MSSNVPEPSPEQGGLQSMLARLRGIMQALKPLDAEQTQPQDILPTWDQAAPISDSTLEHENSDSNARSADQGDLPGEPGGQDAAGRRGEGRGARGENQAVPTLVPNPSSLDPPSSMLQAKRLCPHCHQPRQQNEDHCKTCGWIFQDTTAPDAPPSTDPVERVRSRYQLGKQISARGEVVRFRGLDHGDGTGEPQSVTILRALAPAAALALTFPAGDIAEPGSIGSALEAGQGPQAPLESTVLTELLPPRPAWPSIGWEANLLEQSKHPALPRILDRFREGDFEFLVEEAPIGQSLWDAWEDPTTRAADRFAWLKELALTLDALHRCGAILEELQPDMVVVTMQGQARLTDLSGLLALPLAPNTAIRASYYTAPELYLACDKADPRADLYEFGALVYALHLGRELTDLDFELQGVPKPFLDRFPQAHPLFGRLVSKTFCRDVAMRFPTEEASRTDPTGFQELMQVLDLCGRQLDNVRLEIAAWSTTGMARTGNEDAYSIIWAADWRQDDQSDSALILLADGMGGHDDGERAAALALDSMRQFLLQQPAFGHLIGACAPDKASGHEDENLIAMAFHEANKRVHDASLAGPAPKKMGCTAEAVYIDGRQIIVGHVGDSRTYHLHGGNLIQLTCDQTWVRHMVELGILSSEEAEVHPRRNEIQQAVGGHATVEPDLHQAPLTPGDWVLVCSDGLSNHLTSAELRALLQTAPSAESAARRLVNSANLHGATDNVTVVVVRVT